MPSTQTTTFKGARYITKFADPIEWDDTRAYEAIEAVQHNAFTYLSKQPVPAGVQIDNDDFWLLWADPNAQMEQLRELVEQYAEDVAQWDDELNTEIEARKIDIEKVHVFDTVADMKANANLSVGAICHTNGFYAAGDGGAAWYEIVSSATANEMDVIACGELFANLVLQEDFITPEMIGCPYDGVGDGTNYLQYLVDNYIKVKFLFTRGHVYLITSPITINNPRGVLYGDGLGNTASTGAGAIKYANPDSTSANHPTLFNIAHEGQIFEGLNIELGQYDTGFYAKCYQNITEVADVDMIVKNCKVSGGYNVFDVTGRGCTVLSNSFASFYNLAIFNWNQLAETNPNSPEGYGQRAIRFEDNRLHSFRGTIITVQTGQCFGLQFIGNVVDHGRGRLFLVQDGAKSWNVSDNIFNACSGTLAAIPFFFDCAGKLISNCLISNNVFTAVQGYWEPLPTDFIRVDGIVNNLSIVNNMFSECSGYVMRFTLDEGSQNVIVSNNNAREFTNGLIGLYSAVATALAIIGNTLSTTKQNGVSIVRAIPAITDCNLVKSKIIGNVSANATLNNVVNITIDSTSVVEPWS